MKAILRKIRFRKFRRVFSFVPVPASNPHFAAFHKAEQYLIDIGLKTLAARFAIADYKVKPRGEVLAAEQAFQLAQWLAESNGFSVKEDLYDYLRGDDELPFFRMAPFRGPRHTAA